MASHDHTHEAFADEAYTDHRFRSIALVTMPADRSSEVSAELASVLHRSQVSELKWSKLRQARDRFAAIHVIDVLLPRAIEKQLRIDVLVWDTEDSRHAIGDRDDVANLQRMYYHISRHVLSARWPPQTTWALFPDENTSMDWDRVRERLDVAGATLTTSGDPSNLALFRISFSREFRIRRIAEVVSAATPLAQVADLFAGLGAFSYMSYPRYALWLETARGQEPLPLPELPTEDASQDPGKSDIERFKVIEHLDEACKARRLRVGLKSSCGFRSYDPRLPLNFWLYEPQTPADKAPTRSTQRRRAAA